MNRDDQRITAYALGELQGAQRDAFEAEIADSEELQRELKETLEMIERIETLEPPKESLSDEQRQALREECKKNLKVVRHDFRARRMVIMGTLGTLAACLAIGLVVLRPEEHKATAIVQVRTNNRLEVVSPTVAMADSASATSAATPESYRNIAAASPVMEAPIAELDNKVVAPPPAALAPKDEMIAARSPASPTTQGQQEILPDEAKALEAPSSPAPPVLAARTQTFSGDLGKGSGQGGSVADLPLAGRLFRESDSVAYDRSDAEKLVTRTRAGALDDLNTEAYAAFTENSFLGVKENPLSTFSIDVDTASYANVRRFLESEQRPPVGAIRLEELINYFPYSYPQPEGNTPFSVNVEVAQAPWDKSHQLARIGLKGREIAEATRPGSNLVFLIDVSGSMDEPNKLPLLKRSLQALAEHLSPRDRVAIVVYAGNTGLVLPSTTGREKDKILDALENLSAGGSTNGGAGIKLAYHIATENFTKEGSNRVILCTDGDFNVGTTNESELTKLIEKERQTGVFLSVLGFGTGNLKDSTMEKLADKGNGNYAYIDSPSEGRKVLVEQMGGTLFTIAKDVKIQVEFNPATVAGYRLIGYENRLLAKEDFNDDKKDAGEIGSGHTVTALYEIVPAGQPLPDQPSVDALKYQTPAQEDRKASQDLFTVKLRYKAPDGDKSQLIEVPVASAADKAFEKGSEDFQFAAAVAAFGMKLRGSKYDGDISWPEIQKIARRSLGTDEGSYRAEFLTLVQKASQLKEFQKEKEISQQASKDGLFTLSATLQDQDDGAKYLLARLSLGDHVAVNDRDLQLRVYFYETSQDGAVSLSTRDAKTRWLTSPSTWSNHVLKADAVYTPAPNGGTEYYGYVIGLYYNGKLQAFQAQPGRLSKDFPLPLTLGDAE